MATASRNITDRALRYRANQAIPEHPRVCAFCGDKDVEVGHVDGNESNDSPDNLTWTCRPCNVIAANTLRKAGMGRKTVQFNPTKGGGAANVGEWMNAVGAITPRTDRGDRGLSSTMSVPDAVAMIRSTPHSKRSEFARELGKHKSARAAERWNPKTKRNGILSDVFGSRTTVYDLDKARKETAARAKQSKVEGARLVKEYRAEQKREELRQAKAQREQDRQDARRERQEAREHRASQPKTVGFYKGYQTYKTPDGEYFTSLDRDSWYDTLAQAKRSIDDFQKGRTNPALKKSQGHLFNLDGFEWYKVGGEVYRAPLDATFENGYRSGRWEFPEWQLAQREKAGVYPFAKANPHSKAYEKAYKESGVAIQRFHDAQKAYRTRLIGDAEFLAAKATYDKAMKLYDEAYAKEANPSYEASLIDQARTARSPEELARLYRYGKKRGNAKLTRAAEDRAADLRIPQSVLTKEAVWNPRGQKNPQAGADELYTSFHGKPPDETIEIHQDIHEHDWLGGLGDLTEIYVDTLTGMRLQLTWDGKDTPFLAFTEDGKQAYIKGGKQKLDLKSIKMDGPEWVKDRMVIGQFSEPDPCSKCGGRFKYSEKRNLHVCTECRHVADDNDRVHNLTYRTEKSFDGFQPVDYQHDLGEVTEVRPMLEYEPRNERLYVTGGQYHIEMPLFETSPGIEN